MKAYEYLAQVKDMCLITGTSRDSAILQKLNLIQLNLYDMDFHWRTLEASTDLSTTVNVAYNTVPTDAGIIYDIRQMTTSPYSKVRYVHPYKMHEYVPQPTMYSTNRPRYYTWFAGKIWWYPIPDATYTMTTWYYKKPAGLVIYNTGTASVSGTALTGTSTYWSNNSNVIAGYYFAFTADVKADGTYPWAAISTVTDNTHIVLSSAYTGVTTSGAYVISSDGSFSTEFDPYLIYSTAILESARMREMTQITQYLQQEAGNQLQGLIRNQTSLPDYIEGQMDFAREPILLGDDYAKFPFIMGNP